MRIRFDGEKVRSPGPIEVNVTLHCNLRCKACSHLSPVSDRWQVDPGQLHDDLVALGAVYRPAYVRLLGGEPFLHTDLRGVLDAVEASGIAPTTQICTNGLLLKRVDPGVWRHVQELEVSVYPVRGYTADWLAELDRVRRRGVTVKAAVYTAFRESFTHSRITDPELTKRIYSTCLVAHYWLCHTLHEGVLYKCPQSVLFDEVGRLTTPGSRHRDGVDIRTPRPSLATEIHNYLTAKEPLEACQNCLGSVGVLDKHQQTPRRDWLAAPKLERTEPSLDVEFLDQLERHGPMDDGCSREVTFEELTELVGN